MARSRQQRARVLGVLMVAVLAVTLVPAFTTASTARPAGPAVAERAQAASCAGFKNRVGITNKYVTIANISDVTGPIPNLYAGSRQAVRAFVRYFNATSSICGRKLRVLSLDAGSGASGNQAGYVKACTDAFAAVGSASIGDAGGAARAQNCGIPDLRALTTSGSRTNCTTCFATQVDQPGTYENAVPDYFQSHYPAATERAAVVYMNLAPWQNRASAIVKADQARGWHLVTIEPVDVAQFNYAQEVAKLKSLEVDTVHIVGPATMAIRLANTMQQQNVDPAVVVLDPESYTSQIAGTTSLDGAFVPINSLALTGATSNAELLLYKKWLKVISPHLRPTLSGLFAWSSARLFVQRAKALGGKLNRPNLVAGVKTVHAWTGLGMHAPQDVGGKTNGNCWRIVRNGGGTWSTVSGAGYLCSGKTS